MSFGRDLYKTKLCSLYQRGHCPRQSCSFAHGEAELRRSSSAFNGRRDFRGDLRERLQRRHSPYNKRISPGRDSRGRQDRRQSHSRSPARGRSSRSASPARDKKRQRRDGSIGNLSDVSGDAKEQSTWINGSSDKNTKSQSPDPLDMLEEELQDVDGEIAILTDSITEYQALIDEKTKDIDELSQKNSDLDAKLQKEHEEYKRCNSKLKKFLKLHFRCTRAQDEAKKTQARLQKLVEDLPSSETHRFPSIGDDSDVNVVSDGDGNLAVNLNPASRDPPITLLAVKNAVDTQGLFNPNSRAAMQSKMKPNRLDIMENGANEETAHVSDFTSLSKFVAITDKSKTTGLQTDDILPRVRNWDPNSALPSTGLAAHAEDDAVENDDDKQEGSDLKYHHKVVLAHSAEILTDSIDNNRIGSSIPPQVLSMAPTQYAQYEGDDEEVDVEEMEDDNSGGERGQPLLLRC